jgi:hypothetical protein
MVLLCYSVNDSTGLLEDMWVPPYISSGIKQVRGICICSNFNRVAFLEIYQALSAFRVIL